MADFVWDVQPYALVSELVNRYTRTIISTTAGMAEKRASEAQEWMFNNAPWQDRSDEMRAMARRYGADVPERSAREALTVEEAISANMRRHYKGMVAQAARDDAKFLKNENARRAILNDERPPSRQLKPWTAIPKARSRKAAIGREIRVERGPIVELRFSHGRDIPYGIWLEIAHQGRFAIISKAIDHWAPILMNDIKRIANLVQFNITFGEEFKTERDAFTERVREQDIAFLEQGRGKLYEPWTPSHQVAARTRRRRYLIAKFEAAETKKRQEQAEEWKKAQATAPARARYAKKSAVPSGYLNLSRVGR